MKIYEQWLTDPDTGHKVPPGSARETELLDMIRKAQAVNHQRRTLTKDGLSLTYDGDTEKLISVDFRGINRIDYAPNMPLTNEPAAIQALLSDLLASEAVNKELQAEKEAAEQRYRQLKLMMNTQYGQFPSTPHQYPPAIDFAPGGDYTATTLLELMQKAFDSQRGEMLSEMDLEHGDEVRMVVDGHGNPVDCDMSFKIRKNVKSDSVLASRVGDRTGAIWRLNENARWEFIA